jgi:L-ascorbate peroxidase
MHTHIHDTHIQAVIMLTKIKHRHNSISWADLIQMAGALSVRLAGGPIIDIVYGREDCNESDVVDKVSLG